VEGPSVGCAVGETDGHVVEGETVGVTVLGEDVDGEEVAARQVFSIEHGIGVPKFAVSDGM